MTNLTNIKTKIIPMTTQFSMLFGEHPFEKNGFATLNSQFPWGGMENQTLTSLCPNCWSENLVSHEYAHQWFGDMITCGTWADIWLNEGFATYCEALWYEYTGGYTAYKNDINSDASSYLSGNPGWPMYNASWAITTPPNSTLFNYAITYAKGACVLHMLRYTLGDSLFFAAIKAYATDTVNFKYQPAVTADFLTKLNESTGQDMTWFMQWVYEPNHPVYQNWYNFTNLGGGNWMVGFRARQTQTNAPYFKMPIELRITFASGPDTLIRVMNTVNDEVYGFVFNRQPASLQFDPGNNIVIKQGTTTLSVVDKAGLPLEFSLSQNYPNPFNPETKIVYQLPEAGNVVINIFNVEGQLVRTLVDEIKAAGYHSVAWDGRDMKGSAAPSGAYFYRIKTAAFEQSRRMILLK